MLKKSTLLSVSIFLALFIGLSDYGYGCHEGDKHKLPFAPCGGGGGSTGDEDGLYRVTTIAGPMTFPSNAGPMTVKSNNHWEDSKGGEMIILQSFNEGDIGELDLSFFTSVNDIFFGVRGANCFGSASGLIVPQAHFRKHKGGSVLGRFWFKGCTDEGIDLLTSECITEVLYELDLFGPYLPENWRPASEQPSTVIITGWEMFAGGEGGGSSRSCLGGDDFVQDFHILVERMN